MHGMSGKAYRQDYLCESTGGLKKGGDGLLMFVSRVRDRAFEVAIKPACLLVAALPESL